MGTTFTSQMIFVMRFTRRVLASWDTRLGIPCSNHLPDVPNRLHQQWTAAAQSAPVRPPMFRNHSDAFETWHDFLSMTQLTRTVTHNVIDNNTQNFHARTNKFTRISQLHVELRDPFQVRAHLQACCRWISCSNDDDAKQKFIQIWVALCLCT